MGDIKTYDERDAGTTKVFFRVKNNEVTSVIIGNRAVPTDKGFQFYVENHVADQIDKCEFYLDGLTPKLRLRDGETLEVPQKTEKELEVERLEYELERLKNEGENEDESN